MSSMIPMAILAGGRATRLGPMSEIMPKALVPVAGEPFIAHQLRLARREGIERVVLCLGHLGKMVRDFVGDGRRFDLDVAYSFDGERLLGTGGALRHALPLLGETFFVLYGDTYLDIAFTPVLLAFRRSGAPALMTVLRNEGRWDTSNVTFENGRVTRYDKRSPSPHMNCIDYGLTITEAAVLTGPEEAAFDLSEPFARLAEQGRLAGYEITCRFYEIGSYAGMAETDAYLRRRGFTDRACDK
jgi:NDP-sugar pyrophosphorylase family protein